MGWDGMGCRVEREQAMGCRVEQKQGMGWRMECEQGDGMQGTSVTGNEMHTTARAAVLTPSPRSPCPYTRALCWCKPWILPPPPTSCQPPASSSKAEGCFLFFHEDCNPPFERRILCLMLPDINIIIPKQPQSPAVACD